MSPEPFHQGRIVDALMRIPVPYKLVPVSVFAFYWMIPGLILLFGALLRRELITSAAVSYVSDTTHLIFSLLISLGSLPVYFILKKTSPVVRHTLRIVRGQADHAIWKAKYRAYQAAVFNRWLGMACAGLSLAVFAVFMNRIFDDSYQAWWGHISHGWAGIYFAIIAAQMVLWGTWSFFIAAAVSLVISHIGRCRFSYEPLRADGCNGLRPVGLLIMVMWAYSLMAGVAIFVVFSQGYLDLENNLSIWFISLSASLCLPLVAILPLLSVTSAIRHARERYLLDIERLSKDFSPARSPKEVEKLGQVIDLAETIKKANVFPFRSRAVLIFSLLNIIQITLSARELLPR